MKIMKWGCRLVRTFFGLSPSDKPLIHDSIFTLIHFSSGGFTFDDVYNMPVWLRKFYLSKLAEVKKQESAQYKKASTGTPTIHRPNISRNG